MCLHVVFEYSESDRERRGQRNRGDRHNLSIPAEESKGIPGTVLLGVRENLYKNSDEGKTDNGRIIAVGAIEVMALW